MSINGALGIRPSPALLPRQAHDFFQMLQGTEEIAGPNIYPSARPQAFDNAQRLVDHIVKGHWPVGQVRLPDFDIRVHMSGMPIPHFCPPHLKIGVRIGR
jgi:hypothetical protein